MPGNPWVRVTLSVALSAQQVCEGGCRHEEGRGHAHRRLCRPVPDAQQVPCLTCCHVLSDHCLWANIATVQHDLGRLHAASPARLIAPA